MGFLEIDDKFVLPNNWNPELLDTLPIYKHVYGNPMERIPTKLYWTEYQPWKPGDGTISFARYMCIEYPELANYVKDYLQQFFPKITFIPERVCLLKTKGSIRPHLDESSRKTCINIGIKNADGAITRTSEITNVKDFEGYEATAVPHTCQNGHAYLLNTAARHEVIAVNDNPRYMFSYGFDIPFETMVHHYMPI